MSEMILTDNDLADPSHWPVTVAFGLFDDQMQGFLGIARGMSNGIGYSANDKGVLFWNDLDDFDRAHEERFDVECFLLDNSCRLTFLEFYQYMKLAFTRYSERHPECAEELENDSRRFADLFL